MPRESNVGKTGTVEGAQQQTDIDRLTTQKWRLLAIKVEGQLIEPSGKKVFLAFNSEKQQVYGFAGCNNYFAQFKVSQNMLSFGYLGMTRKMCRSGMALEGQFSQMMAKVVSYGFEGVKLHLYDSEKSVLATLVK